MHRPANSALAVDRARWLAELTKAIDEAQQLAWRISARGCNREAMDLYARLELARSEVESLRRSGWAAKRQGLPPEWSELCQDGRKRSESGPKS